MVPNRASEGARRPGLNGAKAPPVLAKDVMAPARAGTADTAPLAAGPGIAATHVAAAGFAWVARLTIFCLDVSNRLASHRTLGCGILPSALRLDGSPLFMEFPSDAFFQIFQ